MLKRVLSLLAFNPNARQGQRLSCGLEGVDRMVKPPHVGLSLCKKMQLPGVRQLPYGGQQRIANYNYPLPGDGGGPDSLLE